MLRFRAGFVEVALALAPLAVGASACSSEAPRAAASANGADAGEAPGQAHTNDGTPPRDAGALDTGSEPTGCDVMSPFDAPTPLAGVNTPDDDFGASLSRDELTIYFARGAKSHRDIFTATRARRTDPFGEARKVDALSTNMDDVDVALSPDGLTTVIDTYFPNYRSLFMATRTNVASDFGPLVELVNVISEANEDGTPYITAGGQSLYFASSRNNGHFAIFRASKTGAGGFGDVSIVPGIDVPAADLYPVVTDDELTIYFGSGRNRDHDAGLGYATDIFVAHRAHAGDAFTPPTMVSELTTASYANFPNWLSPDKCRIYLSSSRKGGMGPGDDGTLPPATMDIWVAERHR